MKKRILAILTCMAILFSLSTGCSSNQAASEDAAASQPAASDTQSKAEAPKFDFSSVPVQKQDPNFKNGAVLYSDLSKVLGSISVPNKEVKIGFIMKSLENEYWSMMANGNREEIDRMKAAGCNVTVDIRSGQTDQDQEGQLSIMRDMINKKYDCIIAFPISDANLVPGIEDAQKAGIPIVTGSVAYDDEPHVPYYIGLSSYESGRQVAEAFSKKIGAEGGEVSIIMGIPNNPSARDRTAGFKAWIDENPECKLKIVDTQNADWDRMKAKDIADIQIKKYPNLKAIFCNNDVMALGAVESVKAADKLGKIYVAGTDGTNEAIKSIKEGELTLTAGQFSYYLGKMALDIAFRAMDGIALPERVWGSIGIIDSSNANQNMGEVINWKDLDYQVQK